MHCESYLPRLRVFDYKNHHLIILLLQKYTDRTRRSVYSENEPLNMYSKT